MDNVTLTLTHAEVLTVATIVGAAVVGLLVSFIVAYVNHRYTLAQGKKIATATLHKLLILVTALFTGLQYYVPILQEHLRTLESWPYIGGYAVGIYAAANFLYAVKAKAWFQSLLKTAQKLDAKVNSVPDQVPAPQTPTPLSQDESADNFLAS
jgi:glucan phosphoethanolaminetransferase (alkaline phosphatase superfamily)